MSRDDTRWGARDGFKRVGANGSDPGRLVPATPSPGARRHSEALVSLAPINPATDPAHDPYLALAWENVPWEPASAPSAMSRRARQDAQRATYRAAVPPAIAQHVFDIDPAVAAEAEDARAEITRFDAELDTMFPDAEFAPLPSVLLRTESASSSQIENITSGARSLALAEIGISKYGSNARLVAANVAAMHEALAHAETLSPMEILRIHEALMTGQDHAGPGRFRTEPVWIGAGTTPHSATFVPPRHERISAAIRDLCEFTDRTDVPLLTQAALAHAQFETIHPFKDGNGRTGRALVHVILRNGGATTRATVPVSAGLLRDTDGYFDALTAYRAGNPNPIVARFSEAAFAAVDNGRALATDLRDVQADWQRRLADRRRGAVHRAIPHLLGNPAVTSNILQERLGVSQPTADSVIATLREKGILSKASGVQRYTAWVAVDVIDALDAFAERARRR